MFGHADRCSASHCQERDGASFLACKTGLLIPLDLINMRRSQSSPSGHLAKLSEAKEDQAHCAADVLLIAAHVGFEGGRGGASYKESKPLSDIWSLDLTTMNWTEVTPKDGPVPPARFLHSFDMFLPPKSTNSNDLNTARNASSAQPFGIVERRTGSGQGSAPNNLALSGTLMQDEAQLAGRKLMSSEPSTDQPARSLELSMSSDASAEETADSTAESADVDEHEDQGNVSDDGMDSADGDIEDDDDQDEDDDSEDMIATASSAGNATAPSLAPSSGDVDKHHHHHHHHNKKHHKHHHHHHNDKHHKDKKHHKGGKGGLDPHPGPAGGSYSDAKLVVFGGQGEGGCYLNDAWEFDPRVPAWRQISRLMSDDKKCIALQGACRQPGINIHITLVWQARLGVCLLKALRRVMNDNKHACRACIGLCRGANAMRSSKLAAFRMPRSG